MKAAHHARVKAYGAEQLRVPYLQGFCNLPSWYSWIGSILVWLVRPAIRSISCGAAKMGKELKAVRFSKKNVESELLEVVNALLHPVLRVRPLGQNADPLRATSRPQRTPNPTLPPTPTPPPTHPPTPTPPPPPTTTLQGALSMPIKL